ncbi:MAG: RsbRD N-terminal domain-containing protein, partial [Thermodesulfobacteriota bacterium]
GLIKKCFESLLETYPSNTAAFLKNQKDPFANPVGNAFRQGAEAVIHQIIDGIDTPAAIASLDPILRIRAVQGFSPSKSVSFVFTLKKIIREEFKKEIEEKGLVKELHTIEMRIDELSLIAFDVYMECREQLFQIKANEVRNSTFKAFERAGLVCNSDQAEPEIKEYH